MESCLVLRKTKQSLKQRFTRERREERRKMTTTTMVTKDLIEKRCADIFIIIFEYFSLMFLILILLW